MSRRLRGREPSNSLNQITASFFGQHPGYYVAIIFVGDNPSSAMYVHMKQTKAYELGLAIRIFGENTPSADAICERIASCNIDPLCAGILVQLPLPPYLQADQARIVKTIAPEKDCDGLSGITLGQSLLGYGMVNPATPQAVLNLLDWYHLGDVRGCTCLVIGQSNLIGKPLVAMLQARNASVLSANNDTSYEQLTRRCQESDYIFSATGVANLIIPSMVRHDNSQIIVDIGRGKKNGKAHGDCASQDLFPLVRAITPVPGGVGPMTIATLFYQCFLLVAAQEKGNHQV
ncbi:MAG: bifunctional 5,10-methylenetetrahydrofolate dehydrogenase/5,10-methenyltetrahydrofolate cyclohydrolase [Candidatus Absconditabacterales bacterium]|nr:bifunctional 5,10-methylenetetrahydrofolate dehydrogenase/5,10-methenyltetrahydrofolate cyclohydrolase [Candidatus Absconditabacterales bacterium]